MLSREGVVARRLEADRQSLAVMFESLESAILDDDTDLYDGSERELYEAETVCRETTPENMLLGTI